MPRIEELPVTGPVRATPGWTIIQERNFVDPSKAPLNPTSNGRGKRSTRYDGTALSKDALSVRQETALRRRLDALHSENNKERKDVAIAVPKKDGVPARKLTPGVRKILQSERTFKHHLEEEEAALKQQAEQGKSATSLDTGSVMANWAIPQTSANKKRKIEVDLVAASSSEVPIADPPLGVEMPPLPSRDELLQLMTAPPLSYNAAKVGPPPANGPPRRQFCCICGFWGTVKCMICGERTCGLEHKDEHDAACNIYG